MRRKILHAVAAVFVLQAVPSTAATIVNGSFEQGAIGDLFSTVEAGQTNVFGWDVVTGSIDYIGAYWAAQEGTRSIDLAGNAIGALAQTFATEAGESYIVSFYLSRNFDGGVSPRTGSVFATGNAEQLLSFANDTSTASNMDWQLNTYEFTAMGDLTTLTFAADTSAQSFYGLALDNVSIYPSLPEPSTWVMMFLGFGLIGVSMRRRRPKLCAILVGARQSRSIAV